MMYVMLSAISTAILAVAALFGVLWAIVNHGGVMAWTLVSLAFVGTAAALVASRMAIAYDVYYDEDRRKAYAKIFAHWREINQSLLWMPMAEAVRHAAMPEYRKAELGIAKLRERLGRWDPEGANEIRYALVDNVSRVVSSIHDQGYWAVKNTMR